MNPQLIRNIFQTLQRFFIGFVIAGHFQDQAGISEDCTGFFFPSNTLNSPLDSTLVADRGRASRQSGDFMAGLCARGPSLSLNG